MKAVKKIRVRPTRDAVIVDTAFLWARRSTCSRLQVGAVVHRDGRILVQGYNGAPAGLPHCDHTCNCPELVAPGEPVLGGDHHFSNCKSGPDACRAVHAEQNAIAWAARVGVRLEGASIVCTHQPCLSCARSIINAGVEHVTYVEEYRLKDGIDLLSEAGIEVWRFVDESQSRVIGSSL